MGGDLVESETPKREFYQLSDEITGKLLIVLFCFVFVYFSNHS